MTKCQYDTGSMYGCRPACSQPATHLMTYSSSCYGPFNVALCKAHVGPMKARVYPYAATVEELP